MKQLKNRIIVVVLLNLVGVKSFAYDFSVENNDGVTIYYNYVNDGKELEVTCLKCSYYRGDSSNGFSVHVHEGYEGVEKIIIPEEVTYMNRTSYYVCNWKSYH